MRTGKSTLLTALMLAVAQGQDFLGYPTCQGGVAYLALEEHRRDVGLRLKTFGLQPDDDIHTHTGPVLNSREAVAELRDVVLALAIKLVVIDTMALFCRLTDENSNSEIIRQVSPILDLARESEAAIVLSHHERKAGGEEGRGIRGGSALFGMADQALLLERRHGGAPNDRTLKTFGRYAETPKAFHFTLDGTVYRAIGTSDDLDHDAVDQRVLRQLTSGPRTIQALHEELELSGKVVAGALNRLELASKVTRHGVGKKGDPFTFSLRAESSPSQGGGDAA
jgi:hypothetical protein